MARCPHASSKSITCAALCRISSPEKSIEQRNDVVYLYFKNIFLAVQCRLDLRKARVELQRFLAIVQVSDDSALDEGGHRGESLTLS